MKLMYPQTHSTNEHERFHSPCTGMVSFLMGLLERLTLFLGFAADLLSVITWGDVIGIMGPIDGFRDFAAIIRSW